MDLADSKLLVYHLYFMVRTELTDDAVQTGEEQFYIECILEIDFFVLKTGRARTGRSKTQSKTNLVSQSV